MTYSLDLEFIDNRKNKGSISPIANIYVKTFTSNRERIFITPDCVCIQEFEYQVDRLQKELRDILTKTKIKFLKLNTCDKV